MKELWLEFGNETGEIERIRVEKERFVIGRHSDCDLSVLDSAVSREHVSIDTFSEVFVVSDCGSSFGTKLNGEKLGEAVNLKDGDVLSLGDSFEIKVEIDSDQNEKEEDEKDSAAVSSSANKPSVPNSSEANSIPTSFFYVAPILGLLVLLCAGGGLFIAFSGKDDAQAKKDDYKSYSTKDDDDVEIKPSKKESVSPKLETSPTVVIPSANETQTSETPENVETSPTPKTSSEAGNIEQTSAAFLRRIVRNDANAFLTSKQIEILAPKVNQFKSSQALASNLKDAKANSAQIKTLANSTGLTPQFLVTAALTKIGNQRGNVVEAAKSMTEVLGKLSSSIGVETADEALLVIAAYDQGAAGQFTQLRNQAEALSGKTQGVTARQVRTIWFLRDRGKLSDSEFEFALRFLAIGTIMQKPADFSVNAEAFNF